MKHYCFWTNILYVYIDIMEMEKQKFEDQTLLCWLFAIFQNSVKHANGTAANNRQQITEGLRFATAPFQILAALLTAGVMCSYSIF